MDDHELLAPRRFADAIERIARRRAGSMSAASLEMDGVSLTTIRNHRQRVARLLVRDLRADRLGERPARVYRIRTGGKERQLYDFPLVEMILQDVVAGWLAERARPHLSSHLYSYRPGMSYHGALRDFARYVRRSCGPEGGVYVLRRDVRAYFDSIPVRDDAPVWSNIAELIGAGDAADGAWALIRRTLRPSLLGAGGETYRLSVGVPTGSPVANVVANLCLRAMDAELSLVHDAFYARYGDDILVAHPDAEGAVSSSRVLDTHLHRQEVEGNAEKTRNLYLTRAGRAAPEGGGFLGVSAVEFLGHRVAGDGTVALSRRKTCALLEALRARAASAAGAGPPGFDGRLRRAVRAVNALLDPHDAGAHPYAALLRGTVTDRAYLRWLDHEVSLIALEAVMRERSARHFRRVPPRVLRERFRLRSLVVARNRVGRS